MMKKLLLTLTALSLTACGFTPVHAPTAASGASAPFNNVKVELANLTRVSQKEGGYYLQQHLQDRLDIGDSQYVLKIEPKTGRRPYGLTSNDVASRFDMTMKTEYQLVDGKSGDVLTKGTVNAITTFGSSRDPYARISAEKNATEQVSRDAADRIIARLAAYYKSDDHADYMQKRMKAKP